MPTEEENWIRSQRERAERYLQRHRVDHLGVGEYPAFHVFPYVALFAVQSKVAPGTVGWWVVSGDLPTDYVTIKKPPHPREGLRDLANQWQEISRYMARGEAHPDCRIGTPDQWPKLAPLLRSRADTIEKWAEDDEMWNEDECRQ